MRYQLSYYYTTIYGAPFLHPIIVDYGPQGPWPGRYADRIYIIVGRKIKCYEGDLGIKWAEDSQPIKQFDKLEEALDYLRLVSNQHGQQS